MIYLDNHASTRCDPRVVEAMLPWLTEFYGNPHSESHAQGRAGGEAIGNAVADIATQLGANHDAIVVTSGATESNNLAIRGVANHPRQKRRHLVTATSEHPAVLDVMSDLERDGFRVTRVPVHPAGHPEAGVVDLDRLADAIDDDTALVSIMWANNEIGSVSPIRQIADLCHQRGALLHTDATQAVGRIPIDVVQDDVDLLSATSHKFYGPKGTGILIAGNSNRRVRIRPQIIGGGQQRNLRSGTMNPAGVVGFATALRIGCEEMPETQSACREWRDLMHARLSESIEGLEINGPPLASDSRLVENLNLVLPHIEGAAWISATPEVAFSSGSACSSVEAKPSHVLTSIGRDESAARRSVRFGVGRFNDRSEIESASQLLIDSFHKLADQL